MMLVFPFLAAHIALRRPAMSSRASRVALFEAPSSMGRSRDQAQAADPRAVAISTNIPATWRRDADLLAIKPAGRTVRAEFLAALEFAQGADEITDPAELNRRFGEVVRPFGVRYFSSIVAAAPGHPVAPRILTGDVDRAWSERYTAQGFAAIDPVLTALFEIRRPFTWREAVERRPTLSADRMFGEVRDITGTDEALVVPIHDRMGEVAAVVLSGAGVSFDLDIRPVLHLASVYFSGVARDLADGHVAEPQCLLTARQQECLRWVIDGKSDWEIGEILGISEHTVHNHIEAAKRTLEVGTRVQASVQAWRRGWLI